MLRREINDTVMLLVTTTNVTGSDTTSIVTTTALALLLKKRSVGLALVQIRVNDLDYKRRPGEVGLHLTTAIVCLLIQRPRSQFPDQHPG